MLKRVSVIGHGKVDSPAGVKTYFSPHSNEPAKTGKKKALFSLPVDVLDELDAIWLELRSKKKTIDKSAIVALAIKWIIEDYKKNKEDNVISKAEPEKRPFVPLR